MSLTVIDKPKVDIDPEILKDLQTQVHEAGQVILHFVFVSFPFFIGQKIRIWPTTYLFDVDSDHRSDMIHVENISVAPGWTHLAPGSLQYFTLIFSGLPKSCTKFHFEEICNEEGKPFKASNINRNEMDVYYLKISY